jgi:membrane-associated protein
MDIITHLFDVEYLIKTLGLLGIFVVIFAESGLFFAFFLPGDSLLFTAGFLASLGLLPISWLIFGLPICAILAGYVGYYSGIWIGKKIFKREDSVFFQKKYLFMTHHFFEKYGNKAVILSRFVPIVRTFMPILAGVGQMSLIRFSIDNIVGGSLWVVIVTLFGYYLGRFIPNVREYIFSITVIIIFASIVPGVYGVLKNKFKKRSSV